MAPYELPLPREVSGLEHYVPAYLNVPVSYRLLEGGNGTNHGVCSTSDDLRQLPLDVARLAGQVVGLDMYCNFDGRADIVVLFCGFSLVSIIDFSNTLMLSGICERDDTRMPNVKQYEILGSWHAPYFSLVWATICSALSLTPIMDAFMPSAHLVCRMCSTFICAVIIVLRPVGPLGGQYLFLILTVKASEPFSSRGEHRYSLPSRSSFSHPLLVRLRRLKQQARHSIKLAILSTETLVRL